jgi:hypothetical protein
MGLSENGFYDINVALTNNGAGYTASATPHAGGGQSDDTKCQLFAVDHNLRKSAEDDGHNDVTRECWR